MSDVQTFSRALMMLVEEVQKKGTKSMTTPALIALCHQLIARESGFTASATISTKPARISAGSSRKKKEEAPKEKKQRKKKEAPPPPPEPEEEEEEDENIKMVQMEWDETSSDVVTVEVQEEEELDSTNDY